MKPIEILHYENDPSDVELVRSFLDKQGMVYKLTAVETELDFVAALEESPEIILADYSPPSFDGLSALKIVKQKHPDIPFILISGSSGEEYAIESLKRGATDYVLKSRLKRLVPAIKRALNEKKELLRHREAEAAIMRLNTAIEHSSDSIMITGPDGRIEYVNPAFVKNTGYRLDELVGKTPSILKSGIHDREFYEELWETISTGNTWRGVMINRKKDDTLYSDETSISPILTMKGEISGYVAIKRDITELVEFESRRHQGQSLRRRLAESFLVSHDDRMYGQVLRLILENLQSSDGLFGYFDEDNDLIIPFRTEDLWGSNFPGSNNVVPYDEIPDKWVRALRRKKGFWDNEPAARDAGHAKISNIMLVPLVFQAKAIGLLLLANKKTGYTEDDFEFLRGISEYISPILYAALERNRQEEMLQEYSFKLEQMVEERTRELNSALLDAERGRGWLEGIIRSFAGGLLVTDMSDSISLMNRYAEIFFNTRFSDVQGEPVKTLFGGGEIWRSVKRKLEERDMYAFEFAILDPKTNKNRIMRAKVSGIFDRNIKRTANVIILDDITQERELEKLKTDFISIAAHQFRTPLTSIQGFSEILLTENDITPEERQKFLGYINRQAVKLASLISDLLDLTRIETETVSDLETSPCSAGALINAVLPGLQKIYPKHVFMVAGLDQPDEILADREKIEKVLDNLLRNSANYSPLGGTICISGKLLDGFYQLSVTDEGIGMTQEQVDKIFDKFYRVDTSDSAAVGTGLGMSIVKHIVEKHGGEIQVKSNLGEGTKVFFTVPAYKK